MLLDTQTRFHSFLVLMVILCSFSSSCEAQNPRPPLPDVWISSGGAVGETVVVNVQDNQASSPTRPFTLVCSQNPNPSPWGFPALHPPVYTLSAGNLNAQGQALFQAHIPSLKALVGLPFYFQTAVKSALEGWLISNVCAWRIAPNLSRRFVQAPTNPIPFFPGDGHVRTNLADGTVLFCGGRSLLSSMSIIWRNDAFVYDPVKATCVRVGNMQTGRFDHVGQRLSDGTVLVVGGDRNWQNPTAELYDPRTKAFTSLGPVPSCLRLTTATAVRNPWTRQEFVLIAGGYDMLTSTLSRNPLLYDVQNRTVSALPPMVKPRLYMAAAAFPAGAVLITGGTDSQMNVHDDAELFLLQTRQFYPWGKMNRRRYGHAMMTIDSSHALIISGGDRAGGHNDLELFDGLRQTSMRLPQRLNFPRLFCSPVQLPDGSLLLAGGQSGTHTFSGQVPEILSISGSTLLRPIREPTLAVEVHGLKGGGAFALGMTTFHHLK